VAASPATNDLDRVSFSEASPLCDPSRASQQIFVFSPAHTVITSFSLCSNNVAPFD